VESWRCSASLCDLHVACGKVAGPVVAGTPIAEEPTPAEALVFQLSCSGMG